MGRLIPNAFNFWVVVFVALGSTACSYGMSVISSTIGQPSFYVSFHLAQSGEPGYAHTSNMIGAMNGLNSAGSAFGCWFSAWSADKYGTFLEMLSSSYPICVSNFEVGVLDFPSEWHILSP